MRTRPGRPGVIRSITSTDLPETLSALARFLSPFRIGLRYRRNTNNDNPDAPTQRSICAAKFPRKPPSRATINAVISAPTPKKNATRPENKSSTPINTIPAIAHSIDGNRPKTTSPGGFCCLYYSRSSHNISSVYLAGDQGYDTLICRKL